LTVGRLIRRRLAVRFFVVFFAAVFRLAVDLVVVFFAPVFRFAVRFFVVFFAAVFLFAVDLFLAGDIGHLPSFVATANHR
jgi:hypothetical protein